MENKDLSEALSLKNKFAKARHTEKTELTKLRHKLAMELITTRDKIATKRHSERVEILKRRLF